MNRGFISIVAVGLFAIPAVAAAVVWNFDPYQAPTTEPTGWEIPTSDAFKAYQGETITFNTLYLDEDRCTDDSCPPTVNIYPSTAPFQQNWVITGKASFSPTNPNVKTKPTNGLGSGNIYVYIESTFGGTDTVDVTVTLVDNGTVSPPSSGTTKDGDKMHTWVMTVKDKCPTSMLCISPVPCTGDKTDPTTYKYRLDPDIPPTGRPDYAGVSIQEYFPGTATSNLDKDIHVTAAGRAANPTWTNQQWTNYFFGGVGGSLNGSFIPNGNDEITDQNGGFHNNGINDSWFVTPPPVLLYNDDTQTYKCDAPSTHLSQSYTVRRKWYADGTYKINKF